MLNLNFTKRNKKESTEGLRGAGFLPAVFYGKKTESTSISVPLSDFNRVWKIAGESAVIGLDSSGEKHDVLIQDVAMNPMTGVPIHVDFYVLEKGQKVEVAIPLEFIGESPAVKNLGGMLIKVMHELEVEAEAKDLPTMIEVDISSLVDFESRITVADLKLPSGVTAMADPEEVVVIADEAKEEVEEVVAPVDIASIEVEKKDKEEEVEVPKA